MKNYLFIGGCADGQVHKTDGRSLYRVIGEHEDPDVETLAIDTYIRHDLWFETKDGDSSAVSFYRLESLAKQEVWQRLINNYRPL